MALFAPAMSTIERITPVEQTGCVSEVRGLTLLVSDLSMPIGATVEVLTADGPRMGEVVGFDHEQTIVMLMAFTSGVRRGDRVVGLHAAGVAPVGHEYLGRVVDAMGRAIDGGAPVRDTMARPIQPDPIDPLRRVPIDTPLGTGVRAMDTMLTVGRGQRLGIFAGPGVGKSTLLGQIAKHTDADVSIVALVGERGREVNDFLHHALGDEGLRRSVVVVATGDEPAPLRVRAAQYALTLAEFFRDEGLDVVLFMDSVTRFCQAQRQIGLAVGEPPATKGYTPSVFAMLPTLMERCGRTGVGSITGFFTILVEGDDMTEPVSDAVRGILDGHVVLARELANRAHWPAIDVLHSVSRLSRAISEKAHVAARDQLMQLLAAYDEIEDLVNIGAYAAGANPTQDLAIALKPMIDDLLKQDADEHVTFERSRSQLMELALSVGTKAEELARAAKNGAPAVR